MATFVDSSALFAFIVADDVNHRRARETMAGFERTDLLTHNYVVTETVSALASRIGLEPVRALADVLQPIGVHWVDERTHDSALQATIVRGDRRVSLVDHVSFRVMRHFGITEAFAYDSHFADEGFELVG